MTKTLALFAALVAAIAIGAGPAGAITDGELDGNGHPYVGLMVAKNAAGTPLWRCSGTLLSAKVFLTAGHCTEAPATQAEIWFASDVTNAAAHGYPNTGEFHGTTHTHPNYDPNAFYVRDMGVVLLDGAGKASPQYGILPGLNSLDSLKPSARTTFTAVGYGLQKSFPTAAAWKNSALRIRMVSTPHLIQINRGIVGDYSLLLSNNTATGGTCFGDSGGPNFLGSSRVVAGVTSFGLNSTCGGTGGVFRVDRSWSLNWLEDAFGAHLP